MSELAEILKIALIAFMFSAISQGEKTILHWYDSLIIKLPWWLYMPLGGCYRCFVGQACLWYFIITKPFNIVELGFFISAGILSSMIYNKIYCYLK